MTATETIGPGLLAGAESATADQAGRNRPRKRRALLPYLLVRRSWRTKACSCSIRSSKDDPCLPVDELRQDEVRRVLNFTQMVHDPTFWASVQTTAEFTLSMVAIWLCFGLGVALLMNWTFPGRSVVRAALALPWAMPDVPTVLTFTIMLDPNFGVLNRIAGGSRGSTTTLPG